MGVVHWLQQFLQSRCHTRMAVGKGTFAYRVRAKNDEGASEWPTWVDVALTGGTKGGSGGGSKGNKK